MIIGSLTVLKKIQYSMTSLKYTYHIAVAMFTEEPQAAHQKLVTCIFTVNSLLKQ